MKSLLFILSLVSFALITGCTSTKHITRNYSSSSVVVHKQNYRGYHLKEGNKIVLEKSIYTTTVPMVVDGIWGYTLLIELDQSVLESKNCIELPSELGRAFLHTLNAPSYRNVTDLNGEIKILSVQDIGIKVWISLCSKNANWSFEGENLYKVTPINCFGMNDKCIEKHN